MIRSNGPWLWSRLVAMSAANLGQCFWARQADRKDAVPSRRPFQGALVGPAGSNPDGDSRRLYRSRFKLTGPEFAELGEPVVESLGAFTLVDDLSEVFQFVGVAGAKTDPEDQPSETETVQGYGFTRHFVHSAPGQRGHQGAQPDVVRVGGDGAQHHPGVRDSADWRLPEDVVPQEYAVPPEFLGAHRQVHEQGRIGQFVEGCQVESPLRVTPEGRH
jgi:hypothetical protein